MESKETRPAREQKNDDASRSIIMKCLETLRGAFPEICSADELIRANPPAPSGLELTTSTLIGELPQNARLLMAMLSFVTAKIAQEEGGSYGRVYLSFIYFDLYSLFTSLLFGWVRGTTGRVITRAVILPDWNVRLIPFVLDEEDTFGSVFSSH